MPPAKKKKAVKFGTLSSKEKKISRVNLPLTRKKHLEKKDQANGEQKELSQVERELLNIQIRDLQVKLQRREEILEQLQNVTKNYQTQYEREVTDKSHIVEFMKRALQERAVEVTELQDKLIGLQQALHKEKERSEEQLSKLNADFNEQKEKLTEKNMLLSGKLTALEEFRIQKDDLSAKLTDMQNQLETRTKEHKEEVSQLLKKMVTNKEKMKEEVVRKVEEVAAEFRKTSDEQMGLTVKRTITENIGLNQLIKSSSDRTEMLTGENKSLCKVVKDLNRRVEVAKSVERELAKKVESQKKSLRTMAEKITLQEDKILRGQQFLQHGDLSTTTTNTLLEQVERMEEDLSKAKKQNEELYIKLDKQTKQAVAQRNLNRKLCNAIIKSADSIRVGLTPSKGGGDAKAFYKRGNMLQQLLQLLVQAEEVSSQTNYNVRNVNRTASLSTIT